MLPIVEGMASFENYSSILSRDLTSEDSQNVTFQLYVRCIETTQIFPIVNLKTAGCVANFFYLIQEHILYNRYIKLIYSHISNLI